MSKVDRKKVNEIVDQDRDQTILAAIVRVMKSKDDETPQLSLEVINSLEKLFLPELKKVKKMIEKPSIKTSSKSPTIRTRSRI